MKKITLYRPVGLKELQLIVGSNFKAFPPRLEWQPIFYPVMNEEYACEIALKWNTKDEFSGYCGFVTAFDMNKQFLEKYEVQNVGGEIHDELWVPAEELKVFNKNIIGEIRITKTFLGIEFISPPNELINELITKTIVK
ncbi:ADP-ribosylation/crystallin J1 [Flagellimonas sp.]|uniref:ADP-ribosylation/crystallin J1 n=1 Tax=Flagellimonas sp. TaxID=2058762 RepID=UPI003B502591